MTRRRGYIMQGLALGGLTLLLFIFIRLRPEPVVIAPFGKPKPNDSQVIFIITNSSPMDLQWIPTVQVGVSNRWSASTKQPAPTVKKGSTFRTLPAHTAYWLVVSVPEERGPWRVRCVMMREKTALEQRLESILIKLRLTRWQWSVTSPSLPARED